MGLVEAPASAGRGLGDDRPGDLGASFALIAGVASGVRRAREDGAFAVSLGGSCFLGVGVLAGLDEPAPAVVYVDPQADFNQPDSCESGYSEPGGLDGHASRRPRSASSKRSRGASDGTPADGVTVARAPGVEASGVYSPVTA